MTETLLPAMRKQGFSIERTLRRPTSLAGLERSERRVMLFSIERTFVRRAFAAAALIALAAIAIGCSANAPPEPQQPNAPAVAPAAATPQPPSAPPAQPPATPIPPEPARPAPPAATPIPVAAATPPVATPTPRAAEEPTPIPAVFPYTAVDGDGREIVFERPAERIVAFDSAVVEILFAIGEGERVAATHSYVSYPPETKDIPRVGDAFNMDLEAVVALEPDLVFVFYNRFVEDLERAGLKTLYIPTLSDDFEKIADHIRIWGRIVGNPDAAEKVALEFEARVAAVRETMQPIGAGPVVISASSGYWTPGRGTMMQEVFDLLKLENASAEIEGYAQISPEWIIEKNPAIIIASDPEIFLGDPAFENVQAVRSGAVRSLETDALSIQGPRFMEGVEELARLVYPGVFR